jgi:HAD superfamily hydrolase (TIGR01509 family)
MSIPSSITTVIFDVDGLLIDSEPSWNKAYERFLQKYHIVYDPAFSKNRRGIGLKDFIKELRETYHLSESTDFLLEDYRKVFYEFFLTPENAQLLEGAEELVPALAAKEFHLAIATGGHGKEQMQKMLALFKLSEYFSLIVSSDEVARGKPFPDVFLVTAEKLGKTPGECLVLEDAVNGVQAGKAAGMTVYGVNSDETLLSQLKESGADKVFYSLAEII